VTADRFSQFTPLGYSQLLACELLDAVVLCVGNEDVPAPVNGDPNGTIKLPGSAPRATPCGEKRAHVRELLDAVVAVVGDKDIAVPVDRDINGSVELSAPAT
jgi:hypothetical protein